MSIKACQGKSRSKNSFPFDSRWLTKVGYTTKELVRTSQIKLIFLWVGMNCLWAIKLTRLGLATTSVQIKRFIFIKDKDQTFIFSSNLVITSQQLIPPVSLHIDLIVAEDENFI